MSIKVLTGTYASGYAIQAPVYTLSIAAGGYVGGAGISDTRDTTTPPKVINDGKVVGATNGIDFLYGGTVINGGTTATTASIVGLTGVRIVGGIGRVANYATISGTAGHSIGAYLDDGVLINGSLGDTQALIGANDGVEFTGSSATVKNFGSILGGQVGVYLKGGGAVTNGAAGDTQALIEGGNGMIVTSGLGTVTNFGTIEGSTGSAGRPSGVYLGGGGVVTNGSALDTSAAIIGYDSVEIAGAAGTVDNFGTIGVSGAYGRQGVFLADGGAVANGATGDTLALITGVSGVRAGGAAAATITNFGAIDGVALFGVVFNSGLLKNGAAGGPFAHIDGATAGVEAYGLATVFNYGTITGGSSNRGGADIGAYLQSGVLTNGSVEDTQALISGYSGVKFAATSATVHNFGTILGSPGPLGDGVDLENGGLLNNGAAGDTHALISGGRYGVRVTGAAATIQNFGTLAATFQDGVTLASGGTVINGSAADATAAILGIGGVSAKGSATVRNFGTIMAGTKRAGVYLSSGAITNGSATDTSALIMGSVGVFLYGAGTVTNFGTIFGLNGTALALGSSADTLVVEAGSVFVGVAQGDGGLLDLAAASGTIDSIAGGTVVVGAAPSMSTLTGFGTVEVGAGTRFTLSGSAAPGALALDIAGTLSVTGALTSAGAISGAGTLALAGGTAAFDSGTTLTVAKVAMTSGVATVAMTGLTYAGRWTQTGGTLSAAAGDDITFTGAGSSFGGTLGGAGEINITGGSDTLTGAVITAGVNIDTATVTLSGAIDLAAAMYASTSTLIVATVGATLSGGGVIYSLDRPDAGDAVIEGANATATLTNVDDQIETTGEFGGGRMKLINDTAGIIAAEGGYDLTIDTGVHAIVNAGLIEATASSAITIASGVNNTGTLVADGADLTVTRAVTGSGTVEINSATADFTDSFAENVAFTGSGAATLQLARSQTYTGQITGFSKTGATTLDLVDISFINGTTKASYSGTATSGVLTVTDGTHTARITLEGDYTTSTFTVSAAAGGGTAVADPAPGGGRQQVDPMPIHPFVAAMAGLGGLAGGITVRFADDRPLATPLVAAPHTMLA